MKRDGQEIEFYALSEIEQRYILESLPITKIFEILEDKRLPKDGYWYGGFGEKNYFHALDVEKPVAFCLWMKEFTPYEEECRMIRIESNYYDLLLILKIHIHRGRTR